MGLAADVGTLQRFPKVVGNESWTRELAYTGRFFKGIEAESKGFVSKSFKTEAEMIKYAEDLAKTISEKSPVAVVGSKRTLIYSMSHSVEDGLNQVRTMNSGFL